MAGINRGNPGSSEGLVKKVDPGKGAENSRDLHLYADVDLAPTALHHTLGPGPTQAAAGTHRHSDLSPVGHSHGFEDLPEIVVPNEVIVQPTDPELDGPVDEQTLWIDTSIPDARPQVMRAIWENDVFAVTSTTYAHPTKWGTPVFTAPCDGALLIWATCNFDSTGLTNSRLARWRLAVYDISGTIVRSTTVEDDRTRVFSLQNDVSAEMTEGDTYYLRSEFALSHANGTTFSIDLLKYTGLFVPLASFVELTIETDP